MSVAPRGRFSLPVAALRAMLANCTSFQKLVQAASASAALARVYPFGVMGEPTRPFAMIGFEDWNPEAVAGGTNLEYVNIAELSILIEMALTLTGTVTTQNSTTVFRAASLAGFANDHFNGLSLKSLTGTSANQNQSREILDFNGANGEITLATALPAAPAMADTFRIVPASDADAYTWFMNVMGDIMAELLPQSGAGTDLSTVDSAIAAGTGCLALRNPRQEVLARPARDKSAVDTLLVNWSFQVGR